MTDINQAFRINQNRKLASIEAELSVWQDIESCFSLQPCVKSFHETIKESRSLPMLSESFPKLSVVY